MSAVVREQWRQRIAGPSWRALTDDPFWLTHDVVIASNVAARRSYEVWVHGKPFATRPTLAAAKAAVEDKHGPLEWRTERLPLVEVTHYYFGDTTEFTDPVTINVADGLPKTAAFDREARPWYPETTVGPLYHGTSDVAATSIMREGFRGDEIGVVFLTKDPELAFDYANGRARAGGAPCVLKIAPITGVAASEVGYMNYVKAREAGADFAVEHTHVILFRPELVTTDMIERVH